MFGLGTRRPTHACPPQCSALGPRLLWPCSLGCRAHEPIEGFRDETLEALLGLGDLGLDGLARLADPVARLILHGCDGFVFTLEHRIAQAFLAFVTQRLGTRARLRQPLLGGLASRGDPFPRPLLERHESRQGGAPGRNRR